MNDGPDPYAELRRINRLTPKQQGRYLKLTVHCDLCKTGRVARVFDVPNGRLVACSSEANIKEQRESKDIRAVADRDWSKRRAFFITDELLEQGPRLTLVCRCQQTRERLASVRKINDLVGVKRSVSLTAVLSD